MAYQSLKKLYLEDVYGTPVPPLPRQQVTGAAPVQNQITITPWPENVKKVPFVQKGAKGSKEGQGNGEMRVAALSEAQQPDESDDAYFKRLSTYTSGQNKTYDVSLPNGVKFEVKEIKPKKDVRIAKTGSEAEGMIATSVIAIMNYLSDYYKTLDKTGQQTIDTFLRRKIRQKGDSFNVDDSWTLLAYCNDVKKHKRNMGKQFFYSNLKTPLRGDRRALTVLSLNELEQYLTEFCVGSQDNQITATPEENKRLNDNVDKLFKLLSDLYLPSELEHSDRTARGKELEGKAEDIDRELTAFKCSIAPGECRSDEWFCAAWGRVLDAGLFDRIQEKLIGDKSEVISLFPKEVQGLYIVSEEGYEYIPKDQLRSYIYITSLAGQGPKIGRIADKPNLDVVSEEEEDEAI